MNRKHLEELVADFNATCGQKEKLHVQGRNGYVAVDVYRDGKCRYTLVTGTATECGDAVKDRFIGSLKEMLREANGDAVKERFVATVNDILREVAGK